MRRRKLISAIGSASILVSTGCLDILRESDSEPDKNDPNTPENMKVETLYPGEDVVDPDQASRPGFDGEPQSILIGDNEKADDLIESSDEAVGSFVRDTDFESSYVLVIRRGMRSRPDLELAAVDRGGGDLHVKLRVTQPEGDNVADHVTQSILLRITDEQDALPESITVEILE